MKKIFLFISILLTLSLYADQEYSCKIKGNFYIEKEKQQIDSSMVVLYIQESNLISTSFGDFGKCELKNNIYKCYNDNKDIMILDKSNEQNVKIQFNGKKNDSFKGNCSK